MFVLTKTYRAEVAAKGAEIAALLEQLANETARANRITSRWTEVTRSEVKAQLDRVSMKRERDAARDALTDIAGMVTPNCAHIGKRMAARAQQGLGAPSVLHGAPVLKAVR